MGVAVALPGVPDDGRVLNPGLVELVKGIGGLFLRQGHKQAAAGLGIKEDFLPVHGGGLLKAQVWHGFLTVVPVDAGRDTGTVHFQCLRHDRQGIKLDG